MSAAPRPPITEQRLQRLCLWLALVVAKLAGRVLNVIAPRALARLLDEYARNAAMLLVLRAVKRIAFKAPRRGPIPVESRRLNVRRVAGARLRQALRSGVDRAKDRIRALCACLADAERWIAHIVRRLRRGFTKLRRLPRPVLGPRRVPVSAVSFAFAAPRFAADTS